MYLYLRQAVFSIGEKFTFYDERENPVFTASGSFFSLPKNFTLYYNQEPVLFIERAFLSFLPKYTLYDLPSKQLACTVKRNLSFNKNFVISAPHGDYAIDGSLFGYEFDIVSPDGQKIASVHKRYISWGDTYEIFIDENEIPAKIVAGIIISVDNAAHPK